MMKLFIISVTYHMPRNRVSVIVTHATLNNVDFIFIFLLSWLVQVKLVQL
jgi:hypothetical protein